MIFVVQTMAHTPPYMFAVLAYLVCRGVLSLRTRRLAVWRMLIVPGLFSSSLGHQAATFWQEFPVPSCNLVTWGANHDIVLSDRFVAGRSLLFAGKVTAAGWRLPAIPLASIIQPRGGAGNVRERHRP